MKSESGNGSGGRKSVTLEAERGFVRSLVRKSWRGLTAAGGSSILHNDRVTDVCVQLFFNRSQPSDDTDDLRVRSACFL